MILFHTADLHLDSKLEANLPADRAAERRAELLSVFGKIADEAVRLGARAVLVCGDLFDGKAPSPTSYSTVISVIERHPQTDFIVLRGNHDRGGAVFSDRPKNLLLFPEEGVQCIKYDNVAVYGAEDCTVAPDDFGMKDDSINIVMLHGEAKESAGDGTVDLRRFAYSKTDYLALGHYHTYTSHDLPGRGCYVYCGTPAGRGFDECGQKGYVRIDIEDGKISHTFVPLGGMVLHCVQADISGCSTLTSVLREVESAVSGVAARDMVKVELTGRRMPSLEYDCKYMEKQFADRFSHIKIKDLTKLALPEKDYMNDPSLSGTFVRLVMQNESDGQLRDSIISCGLSALHETEAVK